MIDLDKLEEISRTPHGIGDKLLRDLIQEVRVGRDALKAKKQNIAGHFFLMGAFFGIAVGVFL